MNIITTLFVLILIVLPSSPAASETMLASYYWQGSRTASGARYNPLGMTAAHKTLPFGTRLLVTNGGRSVCVTVNDRGPFIKGRSLDLSLGAAKAIGFTQKGVGYVGVNRGC